MAAQHFTLGVFDYYSRKARVYPAIISATPMLLGVITLIGWSKIAATTPLAYAGILVVLYAMSDLARQRGKRIESALYVRLGGMPSVRMLRRNDSTFDEPSKGRYRAFLAEKLGRPAPTAEEEVHDRGAADAFYAAAGTWLRENTRDKRKFPILFDENVTYGFRRNLLGLKVPALVGNFIVGGVCIGLLWPITPLFESHNKMTVHLLIILIALLAHCVYLVVGITWRSVGEAADSYGRQLVIATEVFIARGSATEGPSTQRAAAK